MKIVAVFGILILIIVNIKADTVNVYTQLNPNQPCGTAENVPPTATVREGVTAAANTNVICRVLAGVAQTVNTVAGEFAEWGVPIGGFSTSKNGVPVDDFMLEIV